MSDLLHGRCIVVTGGAGLLGRFLCSAIAEHGGQAVVADSDLDAAQRVAEGVDGQFSGGAVSVALDITDKETIDKLIRETHERCGRIDAVVNSAYPRNTRYGRRMEDVEYADFCDNLGVHLGGSVLVMQRFAE